MKNYVQVTLCYVFISLVIIMLSALLYTQALGGENVDNQKMRTQ